MSKKKSRENVGATGEEVGARLIDVLQSLAQEVETLNHQVGTLAASAQVLTAAIDDVRMELEWTIKNLGRPLWAPTPAPANIGKTEDVPDSLNGRNQTQAVDLPTEQSREPAPTVNRTEGKLWD